MEDWRLGSRQRHRPARRNHVKLAGKQYREAALLSDATCDPAGGIAGSPVDIRAGGTDNRRAGIRVPPIVAGGSGALVFRGFLGTAIELYRTHVSVACFNLRQISGSVSWRHNSARRSGSADQGD
jgi:hypothetical protein